MTSASFSLRELQLLYISGPVEYEVELDLGVDY